MHLQGQKCRCTVSEAGFKKNFRNWIVISKKQAKNAQQQDIKQINNKQAADIQKGPIYCNILGLQKISISWLTVVLLI